ncbi:PREDICTED: elicitor-responsive protein 3-like [Nelumbo nucifera]|uniref:C2 domain-containing protein n=2 Tax=Nelumbo nucifera TaxID=4432 RepID=A0A822XR69_NELNU|nr:PREDICTED: elicitor-responsive protein 3-like [Nelumbo nucifera]DAD24094.1 TPA_asm: hypothetical protein HUJ06_025557 [Nelumbo nucifera]
MSIQGLQLEVTVVGCTRLKDTEWISRQDPYVFIEYGNTRFRTRTSTDGGKNPVFQEKFSYTLIEGIRELSVSVWNSNTLTTDDFIGSGKIQLHKALSQGYEDNTWSIQSKHGRYAGDVRLMLHCPQLNRPAVANNANTMCTTPLYPAPPSQPHYPSFPPNPTAPFPSSVYPSPPVGSYPPQHAYPTPTYPPQTYPSYPATYTGVLYPPHPPTY